VDGHDGEKRLPRLGRLLVKRLPRLGLRSIGYYYNDYLNVFVRGAVGLKIERAESSCGP